MALAAVRPWALEALERMGDVRMRDAMLLVTGGMPRLRVAQQTGIPELRLRLLCAQLPQTDDDYILRRHANALCGVTEECMWHPDEMRSIVLDVVLLGTRVTSAAALALIRKFVHLTLTFLCTFCFTARRSHECFLAARTIRRHVARFKPLAAKCRNDLERADVLERMEFPGRGRQPYLTSDEEDFLAEHLSQRDEIGIGLTPQMVGEVAKDICHLLQLQAPGAHAVPPRCGRNWRRRFLENHPEVSVTKAAALSESRAKAVDPMNVRCFLVSVRVMYEDLYRRAKLLSPSPDASVLWNVDELGIGETAKWRPIVGTTGGQHFKVGVSEQSDKWVTVALTSRADGVMQMPMYVLHEGASMASAQELVASFLPPGTLINRTSNGYMDVASFAEWVKLFLTYCGPVRPQFLYLDAHFSHLSEEALRPLQSAAIHVTFLPAHSSHELQPNDLGINKVFKDAYYDAVEAFRVRHTVAFKFDVGVVNKCLSTAFAKLKTQGAVVASAWARSHLHPLRIPDARDDEPEFTTASHFATSETETVVPTSRLPDVVCAPSDVCLYLASSAERPFVIREAVRETLRTVVATAQELSEEMDQVCARACVCVFASLARCARLGLVYLCVSVIVHQERSVRRWSHAIVLAC